VGEAGIKRRAALETFLEYALGKPEVRIVSAKKVLAWLRQPVALGTPAVASDVAAIAQPR
jgi:hypothetical protein